MSASKHFRKIFTKTNLRELYYSSVRYRSAVGIDSVNRRSFEHRIEENIDVIYRKARTGEYNFSPYREKLILRGRDKLPRVVSIPTIRDKLTLKSLYENLRQIYDDDIPFVHQIIHQISDSLSENIYDGVIKLDIKNFYPSINHNILLNQLKKRIRKKEILSLVFSAINQPTVTKDNKEEHKINELGVPQGLSISNMLANIYFQSIDKKHNDSISFKYFRYVDDILILCDCNETNDIKKQIYLDCKELGLEVHHNNPEKTKTCMVTDEFTYLGYLFQGSKLSVRKRSVNHLRESIIKIFTNYKYSKTSDTALLKWAIDLRITGCIFNGTKYGWLFFFSQINDCELLGSLDHFVKKQANRFGIVPTAISFKKFLRAFNEITNNLTNTKYIPNFDNFSIPEKRRLLRDVFNLKTQILTEDDIQFQFNRRIYQKVKELEKDLARVS